MKSDRALALLGRENPVYEDDLPTAYDAEARLLRERILLDEVPRGRSPRRIVRASVGGASLALATAGAVLLLVGSPEGGPTVENAAAAVKRAAVVTAASAEHSGTAVVRMTHNEGLWAQTTIRWNGGDIGVTQDAPQRDGRPGSELRLVDGTLYGTENGGWVDLGSPENIDPDSGTTPAEYLAAVREDVGGATLRRLTSAMTGLTARQLEDGSTVYSGSVAAGLVAREPGFKEGESIRVLPFGYVAHDEADDPAASVEAAVTVGANGTVRKVTASWGAWRYLVVYSRLGTTAGPVAPANARSLLRDRLRTGE